MRMLRKELCDRFKMYWAMRSREVRREASAKKAGATDGIQSTEEGGSSLYGRRELRNNFQFIFQGICFELF